MKKAYIYTLLLTLTFTACGSPKVDESYVEPIDEAASTSVEIIDETIDNETINNETKEINDSLEVIEAIEASENNNSLDNNETIVSTDLIEEIDNENIEPEIDIESSSDTALTEADADTSDVYEDENNEVEISIPSDANAKIRALQFPTLSGTYHGDGNGPGANWRSDFDYANLNVGDTSDDGWAMKNWDDLADRLTTFTASNGVTIKVLTNLTAENAVAQYYPIYDGEGADMLPGNPFMVACDEACYARGESMSKALNSDLDFVMPVTSVKRTSIDVSDPDLASLKASMDASFSQAEGGYGDFEYMYYQSDAMYLRDGGTNGTPIQIERIGDYWEVTFRVNPAKNLWSWLRNSLNYITPDSSHVYQFIYDTAYGIDSAYNSDAIVANTWYSFGNSQVYIVDTTGMGQMIYRFK